MKVLVIGGTQFFGMRIVEGFLARGDEVHVYSRGRRRPPFWDRIQHIAGDRADRRTFVRHLEGRRYDVVVDQIAYERADLEASVRALRGRVGHYVLMSTGSVYDTDTPSWRPIREEDADLSRRGDSTYAEGKRACEALLADERPFDWTVIRPPIVLGPDDPSRRGWFWIQRVLDGGPVLVPDAAPAPVFRLVYSGDLAAAVLRVAGERRAFGRVYNVAMEELLTVADFVRLVAERAGLADPTVTWPAATLTRDAPWYRPTYVHRFVLDVARARAELGFASSPLAAWLDETVRWHREAPLEPSAGYGSRADEVALAQSRRQ